jgi:hypothetical protein
MLLLTTRVSIHVGSVRSAGKDDLMGFVHAIGYYRVILHCQGGGPVAGHQFVSAAAIEQRIAAFKRLGGKGTFLGAVAVPADVPFLGTFKIAIKRYENKGRELAHGSWFNYRETGKIYGP